MMIVELGKRKYLYIDRDYLKYKAIPYYEEGSEKPKGYLIPIEMVKTILKQY